jgi:hypothetical protein
MENARAAPSSIIAAKTGQVVAAPRSVNHRSPSAHTISAA